MIASTPQESKTDAMCIEETISKDHQSLEQISDLNPNAENEAKVANTLNQEAKDETNVARNAAMKKIEERSRRLIETLQREKSHLQHQCSAFETTGIQAAIHNAEMKRLLHNMQGTVQTLRERNHFLTNQINGMSLYMRQVMPNYYSHVNRVKLLEMNHCNMLKSYAELKTFCDQLVQQCGTRPTIRADSNVLVSKSQASIQTENITQTEPCSKVILVEKSAGAVKEADHSMNAQTNQTHKHRPFLQPKPTTHVDQPKSPTESSESKFNISHDLLLEGDKKVQDSEGSHASKCSKKKSDQASKNPVGSPRPSLQPLPTESGDKNTNRIATEIGSETPRKKAFPKKRCDSSKRHVGPERTAPNLQLANKSAFTESTMEMTESRHVSPSPTIRTQAGHSNHINMTNAVSQQHVHHYPYQSPQYFMHNRVPHYHVDNEHIRRMNNQNENNHNIVPMLHNGVSMLHPHNESGKKFQRGQKRSVSRSGRGKEGCAKSASSDTKRRKVSISVD